MECKTELGRIYLAAKAWKSGGQGTIFELKGPDEGLVLKLYPSHIKEEERLAATWHLRKIKRCKLPKAFISVKDIVVSQTKDGQTRPCIGYVMDKLDAQYYKSICEVLHMPSHIKTLDDFKRWWHIFGLEKRLFLGLKIAQAFRQLHKEQFTYCDISENNLLIHDYQQGPFVDMKVIDVDNIYHAGSFNPAIRGTLGYIAPEVRLGKPSTISSDDYALAVLIYKLLRLTHPFVGRTINKGPEEEEEKALFAKTDYVGDTPQEQFIPLKYDFMTNDLAKIFRKMFVAGKTDPLVRPTSLDLEKALLKALGQLVRCPRCGSWHYARHHGKQQCPWCDYQELHYHFVNIYIEDTNPSLTAAEKRLAGIRYQVVFDENKGLVNDLPRYYVDPLASDTSLCFLRIYYDGETVRIQNPDKKRPLECRRGTECLKVPCVGEKTSLKVRPGDKIYSKPVAVPTLRHNRPLEAHTVIEFQKC